MRSILTRGFRLFSSPANRLAILVALVWVLPASQGRPRWLVEPFYQGGIELDAAVDRAIFHRHESFTQFVATRAPETLPADFFDSFEPSYYESHRPFYLILGAILVWFSMHVVFWCLRPVLAMALVRFR